MKMEPIVSSETSAIRTQTPGNYPKRNKLHLEHGESLKTRYIWIICFYGFFVVVEYVHETFILNSLQWLGTSAISRDSVT